MQLETLELVRIIVLGATAFVVAILLTPILTHFLYKYRFSKQIKSEKITPVFNKYHKHKAGTPTMGGILIWGTAILLLVLFYFLAILFPESNLSKLNFLDRGETYLPIAALIIAALFGMVDDIFGVLKIGPRGGGLKMRDRMILYTIVALLGAFWFYFKLDWTNLSIPFLGEFNIGIWYIPFFIFVIVATAFSTNETDGLDGLSGGVLMVAYSSFGIFAFLQGDYHLTGFIAVVMGALLAYLWFNIPPARFYMGDTGAMSLGVTLGVIAMLTDKSLLLPFVGFILVAESLSVILQIFSKKIRGKKIFRSTPIHHHFEALGWPESKVVMRFWIISAIMAGFGIIIGIVGY
ncbi:MAG: phospho-N-acetylmuramoyl-pentapeptide-transferase [Candidatus Spechtbacteria bacterium RIFCSPLOWO2_02_FULL_38_8]|uniref:Phospho-N-acetylmuramoyl-pentapeptide-transferase n=1 Tax=Candidatus Spechtbacteria bacterium RIFCSPLOWO2_02_FULL_38_8 TaxID=1802164 RepID=A0A1G2HFR5_9BACT|nr:MAG: phospho-N-acetylmuramoyl-pentapeptide-transferase [Candidatus Spechtbacteria bacterium RIFCSPLOWO2_02_FULL_38_8]